MKVLEIFVINLCRIKIGIKNMYKNDEKLQLFICGFILFNQRIMKCSYLEDKIFKDNFGKFRVCEITEV